MINCDDHGDVWITRLSEDEVMVITDGNHYSNHVLALPKGHPTKVITLVKWFILYVQYIKVCASIIT